MTDITSVYCG